LLYWCKSTNTDAAHAHLVEVPARAVSRTAGEGAIFLERSAV